MPRTRKATSGTLEKTPVQYKNDEVVSIDGSWEAGVNGAQPGIIMKATPQIGDIFRQEFDPGNAEDMTEVLSLTASTTTPYAAFTNCVMTKDFSGLEPDAVEHKYYANGVGIVESVDIESGEGVKLIDIQD